MSPPRAAHPPSDEPAGDDGTSAAADPAAGGEEPDCTPLTALPGGDVSKPPATDEPFPWDRDDPKVREGFDNLELISGGPPPDGITPIDEPCFDVVATADAWLEPPEPRARR